MQTNKSASMQQERRGKFFTVTPAFGSSRGGTIVQLEGAHFINDGRLTCKFGDLTVPAFRFISSALVLCRTPIAPPGEVQAGVMGVDPCWSWWSQPLCQLVPLHRLALNDGLSCLAHRIMRTSQDSMQIWDADGSGHSRHKPRRESQAQKGVGIAAKIDG
eukprot:Skav206792  [mRNA]  locus=scaffold1990:75587:81450:- [translate_table: standard]